MIRLALLLAGIGGAAARPALVHVLHDAGRAALALRGARGVDADRADAERALDAALTLPDDCYAPRDGGSCWISDPYAVELADAEDYAGADRIAELEGRS